MSKLLSCTTVFSVVSILSMSGVYGVNLNVPSEGHSLTAKDSVQLSVSKHSVSGTGDSVQSSLNSSDELSVLDRCEWIVVGFDNDKDKGAEVTPEERESLTKAPITMTLDLKKKMVSGTGGCNRYNVGLKEFKVETITTNTTDPNVVEKGRFEVAVAIATTLMACDGIVGKLEQRFLATLPEIRTYEFSPINEILLLKGDKGGINFKPGKFCPGYDSFKIVFRGSA